VRHYLVTRSSLVSTNRHGTAQLGRKFGDSQQPLKGSGSLEGPQGAKIPCLNIKRKNAAGKTSNGNSKGKMKQAKRNAPEPEARNNTKINGR